MVRTIVRCRWCLASLRWPAPRTRRARRPCASSSRSRPGGPVDFVARVLAEGLGKELDTTVHRRQQARRQRRDQRASGDQRQARRQHAVAHQRRCRGDQSGAVREADLQDERLRAGVAGRQQRRGAGHATRPIPREVRRRARRAIEAEEGPDADRVVGHRQHAAPGDGIARRLDAAPTCCTCRTRARRRRSPTSWAGRCGFLRRHSRPDRPRQERQAQGARHGGAEAQPALPDVPTLAEQGIHGVESNNWYALFVPAKTPPARIDAVERRRAEGADDRAVPHAPARVRRRAGAGTAREAGRAC